MAFLGPIAWMLGSEIGRKLALTLLAMAALGIVIWRIYAKGRSDERAKQAAKSLENLRERVRVDDEITRLPSDERRRKLQEWVAQ